MSWLDEFDERLDGLGREQLLRVRRVVSPQGGARLQVDGRSMLAFCSNDYLGLAGDPALVEAAIDGARRYGVGATASPMVCGHSVPNAALEATLADWVQLPRALYFYAGFATNASIVPALVGDGDALFSDALNHACLIDGARLSRARIHRYAHADLEDLAAQLRACPARRKLVLSDAVFSMDGDVADLPRLVALCEAHDALLLIDDAHGLGVLGPQGRGTLADAGLTGAQASRHVLYMATLGKALGVAGAFVAGPPALIEWLLQRTRSYTYATAPPPLLAQALLAAVERARADDWRRDRLRALIERLRARLDPAREPALRAAGWHLLPSATPIQPLIVGDNDSALRLMDGLRQRGLWVPAIRPPTVPPGTARLRIALSAAHQLCDVDVLADALIAQAATAVDPSVDLSRDRHPSPDPAQEELSP